MGRSPCCDKNGLKKGPWTPEEDMKLTHYIQMHGPGNWRTLPKNAGKFIYTHSLTNAKKKNLFLYSYFELSCSKYYHLI